MECSTKLLLILYFSYTFYQCFSEQIPKHNDATYFEDYFEYNNSRTGKFFPWPFILPFYRRTIIPRLPCNNEKQSGTCLSKLQCDSSVGIPIGRCAHNRGVCCAYVKTCDDSTNAKLFYFTNPQFPFPNTGGSKCQVTVNKASTNICQLKLTFIQLNLAQPNEMGDCKDDFLSLGSQTAQIICGDNNDKTVYLEFDPNCDFHQITIDTSSSQSTQRFWNIEITQIECDSVDRAPTGCLMYFNSTSGTVSSFNYDDRATNPIAAANRQLNHLNYGVCIRPANGYCEIEWTQSSDSIYSFSISNDTRMGQVAVNGSSCDHNFIVIPAPAIEGTDINFDRFCGNKFPSLTTKSQPYVVTVKTNNGNEDKGNRGFKLDFRQIPCK